MSEPQITPRTTPLKQAIINRISSNKKITPNVDTTASKMRSSCKQTKLTPQQIVNHQSQIHKGYFQYQNWLDIHPKYFQHVPQQTAIEFFKILRILNFGQAVIPSGLVYDIVNILVKKSTSPQLEASINRFLKLNNLNDTVYGFRELKKYRQLNQIQFIYKGIDNCNITRSQSTKKISIKSSSAGQDVFTRVYKDSHSRKCASIKMYSQALVKQAQSCKFHPTISKYNSQQTHQCDYKPNRICQQKYLPKSIQDSIITNQQLIKRAYEYKIGEQVSLSEIPGVDQHVQRNKMQQNKIKRLQRAIIKPVILKKHIL